MKLHKVTVEAALDDWKQDAEYEQDLSPELIKKWANDAAIRMITDEQLVHNLTLLLVRDYRAELPENFRFINQAAYNVIPQKPMLREQLVEWVGDFDDCELKVNLDCADCAPDDVSCSSPIATVDVNAIWASANPQTQTAYMKHFYDYGSVTARDGRNWMPGQFTLMRPTSNTFYAMENYIGGCYGDVDKAMEYKVEPPNIITNFKKGQILLSYMGADVDSEGWHYIPNHPDVFEAIRYTVEERLAFRAYRKEKSSPNRAFWNDVLIQKERMVARAKSKLQIPDAEEWVQLMRNHWNKLLPYWNHEANLNRTEPDRFQAPNESYNWSR